MAVLYFCLRHSSSIWLVGLRFGLALCTARCSSITVLCFTQSPLVFGWAVYLSVGNRATWLAGVIIKQPDWLETKQFSQIGQVISTGKSIEWTLTCFQVLTFVFGHQLRTFWSEPWVEWACHFPNCAASSAALPAHPGLPPSLRSCRQSPPTPLKKKIRRTMQPRQLLNRVSAKIFSCNPSLCSSLSQGVWFTLLVLRTTSLVSDILEPEMLWYKG